MDKKKFIDLNIDLGHFEQDLDIDLLIDKVSSLNITYAFDNKSPIAIKNAIMHSKFKHKVIGANICIPDSIDNPLALSDDEVEAFVLHQLGAISAFASAESLNVEYVRPYGLMYELLAENLDFAVKVAKAIKKFNKWLILYGPTGEVLSKTSDIVGINVAHEICINAQYVESMKPKLSLENKLDNEQLINRLKSLIQHSELDVDENKKLKVFFDTIHIDLMQDNVLEFLSEIQQIVNPRPVNFNNAALSGWVE